jgi:hypothetical protein
MRLIGTDSTAPSELQHSQPLPPPNTHGSPLPSHSHGAAAFRILRAPLTPPPLSGPATGNFRHHLFLLEGRAVRSHNPEFGLDMPSVVSWSEIG